jgi:hypothetical protein
MLPFFFCAQNFSKQYLNKPASAVKEQMIRSVLALPLEGVR